MNTAPSHQFDPGAEPRQPQPGAMSRPLRLHRSRKDRMVAGVCGGLGRYPNVDPVVPRIATVALIFAGVGIPAYIIAWIAIPETDGDEPEAPVASTTRTQAAFALGIGLVALGGPLLVRGLLPWFDSTVFWPLIVLGAGLLLVVTGRR